MALTITEDFRISHDPLNWIVEKRIVATEKAKVPGEVRWVSETYHASFEQAVMSIFIKQLKQVMPEDIKDVVQAVREAEERIVSAVNALNGE